MVKTRERAKNTLKTNIVTALMIIVALFIIGLSCANKLLITTKQHGQNVNDFEAKCLSYGEEFSETEKALCDSNAYNAERIISAEQYNFMFIAHSICNRIDCASNSVSREVGIKFSPPYGGFCFFGPTRQRASLWKRGTFHPGVASKEKMRAFFALFGSYGGRTNVLV